MLAGRRTTTKITKFRRALQPPPNSRLRTSPATRDPASHHGSVAGLLISATTAKTSPFSSRPATVYRPYLAFPLQRRHRPRLGPNPTDLEKCPTPSSRAAFTTTPMKMFPNCRPAFGLELARPKRGAIKGKTGAHQWRAQRRLAALARNRVLVEGFTRSFKDSSERSSMVSIRGRTHKRVCPSVSRGTEITPCTIRTVAALAVDQALLQARGLGRHCLRVKSRRGSTRKR